MIETEKRFGDRAKNFGNLDYKVEYGIFDTIWM